VAPALAAPADVGGKAIKAAGLAEDDYKDAPAKQAAAVDTDEGMGVSVCGGSGLGVADGVTYPGTNKLFSSFDVTCRAPLKQPPSCEGKK
jgi:hypothetical protein